MSVPPAEAGEEEAAAARLAFDADTEGPPAPEQNGATPAKQEDSEDQQDSDEVKGWCVPLPLPRGGIEASFRNQPLSRRYLLVVGRTLVFAPPTLVSISLSTTNMTEITPGTCVSAGLETPETFSRDKQLALPAPERRNEPLLSWHT